MGQKVGSNPRKSANPYDRTPEYRHASGTGVFRIPSAVNVFGMRWLVGSCLENAGVVSNGCGRSLDSFLMPQRPVLSLF
jgi:hypothetical protein